MSNMETQAGGNYEEWVGRDAYSRDGEKIGEIKAIYYDIDTARPEWLAISTGWFGTKVSFAPIVGSSRQDGGLRLDVNEDLVKGAPNVEEDGELSEQEEARLYEHYSISPTGGADAYAHADRTDAGYEVGQRADTGYTADETAITRHEEELKVGKERREAGRVRLRKYTTTDTETVTVPVEKEQVVVERAPADSTAGGGRIGEDEETEVVLHEEEAVVDKDVVAKEQVRVGKETVTDQERVQGEVRREQVEVEGDADVTERR